jgi:hypothetical protein
MVVIVVVSTILCFLVAIDLVSFNLSGFRPTLCVDFPKFVIVLNRDLYVPPITEVQDPGRRVQQAEEVEQEVNRSDLLLVLNMMRRK